MRYHDGWGEPEPRRRNKNTGLKFFGGAVVLIVVGTLAYTVGNRLSDEALGVLAGAVCGVGAAIPTTILVLFVASKLRGGGQQQQQPMYTRPQVMVIPPMQMQQMPQQEQRQPATWGSVPRRHYEIVGDPDD